MRTDGNRVSLNAADKVLWDPPSLASQLPRLFTSVLGAFCGKLRNSELQPHKALKTRHVFDPL